MYYACSFTIPGDTTIETLPDSSNRSFLAQNFTNPIHQHLLPPNQELKSTHAAIFCNDVGRSECMQMVNCPFEAGKSSGLPLISNAMASALIPVHRPHPLPYLSPLLSPSLPPRNALQDPLKQELPATSLEGVGGTGNGQEEGGGGVYWSPHTYSAVCPTSFGSSLRISPASLHSTGARPATRFQENNRYRRKPRERMGRRTL